MRRYGVAVTPDGEARRFESIAGGKLVVETFRRDLGAEDLIARCKDLLTEIEQAFRPDLEILAQGPACLSLGRTKDPGSCVHLRPGLSASPVYTEISESGLSVERSMERLKTVKSGTLRVQAQQVPYLTALNETHKSLLKNRPGTG